MEDITKENVLAESLKLTDSDIKRVLERKEFIKGKIKDSQNLHHLLPKYDEMISILTQEHNKKDNANKKLMSIIAFCFDYIDSDYDIIPDSDPHQGHNDDELILNICYKLVKEELSKR